MMTYHKSLAAKLGKTLPTAALALGLAFSAQAATTTNPTLT